MVRLVVFGLLSVAAITAAGWLYQVHHLVPVNIDQWSILKGMRDLGAVCLAMIWLFLPSRALAAVAMSAAIIAPVFVGLNPPGPIYIAAGMACVGLAVLAAHVRRGMPSIFAKDGASAAG